MGKLRPIVLGVVAILVVGCGAGLPPEEAGPRAQQPLGCESGGRPLDFTVTNDAASVYWAADGRINPNDPTVDQSQIKLVMDIPSGQLPTGVNSATIRVGVLPNAIINDPVHVDTVFQIVPVSPSDLTGFAGSGANQIRLAIRYDPVACEIPADVEADLVLGRFNTTSGTWLEVCGDTADTSLAVREVSCADGDMSFGVFGVIPRVGDPLNDLTPPFFPTPSFSLASPRRCNSCLPPSIDLEWGPASDGGGSGIRGYWIYVDNVRVAFTTDTTATPNVTFTLQSSGTLDTTRSHLYQVQAVDNADNVSALFGALRT